MAVLQRKHPLEFRRATFGQYFALDGELLDEVVVTSFRENKSFTGEAMLELSCHGNPLISNKIIEDLVRRGCRIAEPGEFSRTAFLNGRIDLSQAEAISDLIQARSDLALRFAQKQLSGSVGKIVAAFTDRLLRIVAQLEAYIDFPEEDLPAEDQSGPVADLRALIRDLEDNIQNSRYKPFLDEGIRTVIIGPPNAGKSSLINALTGEDRAIVSEEPGTTRDYIKERIALEEFGIQILDTAGLHEPDSKIEELGIRKTMELVEQADFFLVVLDAAAPLPAFPADLVNHLLPENSLVLANKSDLDGAHPLTDFLPQVPHVQLSLKTKEGYPEFMQTWLAHLRKHQFSPPSDVVVWNARHAQALAMARDRLGDAFGRLKTGKESILVVSDLRDALTAFGEVIGKVDNESMLDILFKEFCIGK